MKKKFYVHPIVWPLATIEDIMNIAHKGPTHRHTVIYPVLFSSSTLTFLYQLVSATPRHNTPFFFTSFSLKMDPMGFRHRPSDRLLGVFTLPPLSDATTGDELNEAELFWSGDVHVSENQRPVSPHRNRRPSFDRLENSGILAVLNGPTNRSSDRPVLCRKTSISPSSSGTIPSILGPLHVQNSQDKGYLSQSMPARKFQQSAPMKVPLMSTNAKARRKNVELDFVDDDVEDDDEVLPPHELVARGSGVLPNTTFSVLEGVGRTLKGRDLRQVRNAIWRKTGFLDL